jgi:adenylate cyclase
VASPYRYSAPPPDGSSPKFLAPAPGVADEPRFRFHRRLEVGRDDGHRLEEPGLLLIADPTVSRSHCVVSQRPDGRCFVRDVSRNGTRLAGRRLVPNVEAEWHVGESITIGEHELVLLGDAPTAQVTVTSLVTSTVVHASRSIVTVLVGDVRDYTVLVRQALSEQLQRSIGRVFERLAAGVVEHEGTLKEYQGDAIVAYWEGDASGEQALKACRAALALDALSGRLARDASVWAVPGFPLHLDWALSTGLVLIDTFGKGSAAALSLMGEPVVRAFRIEKYANDQTGRILACSTTHRIAERSFMFRSLGPLTAKGFDQPDHVFALLGEKPRVTP